MNNSGSKTRKELLELYKISGRTFDQRIKAIKPLMSTGKRKRVYIPKEVRMVYETLGLPDYSSFK